MADILTHNALALANYNLKQALTNGIQPQGTISADPTQYATWPASIPTLITENALCVHDSASGYFRNGACCLWTVPSGATSVRFELWGAGAGSGAGVCCGGAPFGATGAYASLIIPAKEGCQYTLCAGGASTAQSYCTCCADWSGSSSTVTGFGLAGLEADGGCSNLHDMIRAVQRTPSWTCCRYMARCTTSASACICAPGLATFLCFASSCQISCCATYPCITREFSYDSTGRGVSIWGCPVVIPSMFAADWFDTNFFGCMCDQPTILPGHCVNTVSSICCVSYSSGTCCGASQGGACTGNRVQPGKGGYFTHIMGGNTGLYGDWGRTGMVKVSWC